MGGIIKPNSPTSMDTRCRLLQISAALAVEQPSILKTVLFDTAEQLAAAGSPASGQVVSDCNLTPDNLPALAAISVGGAPVATGPNRLVSRDYLFLVLFYQLCDASVPEQTRALDAAWSKLDELPDYFASRAVDRLKFNDSGLRGVSSIGHMADDGVDLLPWLGQSYSAVTYTLPVVTTRG